MDKLRSLSRMVQSFFVVLIQDGHASHVSIKLIELARANDVHILCLPAHTTHLFQPLDIGVFKSFKVFFSKACSFYLSQHPGRVITNDIIASLISSAVSNAFTPNNIMSGFRKTGIHPLNPGVIDDKMLYPSRAFKSKSEAPVAEGASSVEQLSASTSPSSGEKSVEACLFSPEQQKLYEQRYSEGYDVPDEEYESWLRIMHPSDTNSGICSSRSSACKSSSLKTPSSSVSLILQEMLVLPRPKNSTGRKRKALNSKGVCITDSEVLDGLLKKEEETMEKQRKKSEREEQKKAKSLETEKRKAEAEQKRKTKEIQRKKRDEERITRQTRRRRGTEDMKRRGKEGNQKEKSKREKLTALERDLQRLTIDSDSSSDQDTAVCPSCGLIYPDTSGLWIVCDACDAWFDLKCTDVDENCIPDVYYCPKCRV